MILSLIAAIGKKRELGKENQMLWHISEDFKNFKSITMGHHLLMGRKTYESIGRALPGRTTIVVTRNSQWSPSDNPNNVKVVSSIEKAINLAKEANESELFVCGGAQIYQQTLSMADKFYLSQVDFEGDADVYFPAFTLESFDIIQSKDFPPEGKSPAWQYFELQSN